MASWGVSGGDVLTRRASGGIASRQTTRDEIVSRGRRHTVTQATFADARPQSCAKRSTTAASSQLSGDLSEVPTPTAKQAKRRQSSEGTGPSTPKSSTTGTESTMWLKIANLEQDTKRLREDWHAEVEPIRGAKVDFYRYVAKAGERWRKQQELMSMLNDRVLRLENEMTKKAARKLRKGDSVSVASGDKGSSVEMPKIGGSAEGVEQPCSNSTKLAETRVAFPSVFRPCSNADSHCDTSHGGNEVATSNVTAPLDNHGAHDCAAGTCWENADIHAMAPEAAWEQNAAQPNNDDDVFDLMHGDGITAMQLQRCSSEETDQHGHKPPSGDESVEDASLRHPVGEKQEPPLADGILVTEADREEFEPPAVGVRRKSTTDLNGMKDIAQEQDPLAQTWPQAEQAPSSPSSPSSKKKSSHARFLDDMRDDINREKDNTENEKCNQQGKDNGENDRGIRADESSFRALRISSKESHDSRHSQHSHRGNHCKDDHNHVQHHGEHAKLTSIEKNHDHGGSKTDEDAWNPWDNESSGSSSSEKGSSASETFEDDKHMFSVIGRQRMSEAARLIQRLWKARTADITEEARQRDEADALRRCTSVKVMSGQESIDDCVDKESQFPKRSRSLNWHEKLAEVQVNSVPTGLTIRGKRSDVDIEVPLPSELHCQSSKTAILEALEEKNEELCMVLLFTANYRMINHRDEVGRTALHLAARYNFPKLCQALLDHRLFDSADAVHWGGWTALHLAARQGHVEPAKIIMSSPKFHKVNALDGDGRSVLHCAAIPGNLELLKAILKNPVFTAIDIVNHGGFTALHVAERHGHADACKMISDHLKMYSRVSVRPTTCARARVSTMRRAVPSIFNGSRSSVSSPPGCRSSSRMSISSPTSTLHGNSDNTSIGPTSPR